MIRLAPLAVALALALPACLIPAQPASNQPAPAYGDGSGGESAPASDPYAPAAPEASQPAAAPAGPVSVTIVNRCRDTVPVFFGTKPKYGSGTQSSLSGNSRQSKSMQPGEMIWLTDASGSGLSSATIAADTREVEVDCGAISAR